MSPTPAKVRDAAARLLAWWFGKPGTPVKPDPEHIYLCAAFARDAAGEVAELEAENLKLRQEAVRLLAELSDAKRVCEGLAERVADQSAILSRSAEKGAVSPAGNVIFDPEPRE